jgi:hypothetical protein
MLPQGPGKPSRHLVWIEGDGFGGWGCSQCAWVFNPPRWPFGDTLTEQIRNSQELLSEEFESHSCANH